MKKSKILFFLFIVILVISCNSEIPVNYQKTVKIDSSDNKLIRINKFLNKKDSAEIEAFCDKNKINAQIHPMGFYYWIETSGDTVAIGEGSTVEISYTLGLLNGFLCYNSDSTGNKAFVVGKSAALEQGLDYAIRMLHKGDKAIFIFPPFLAYGLIGDEICIPARATIVYYLQVVDVK